MTPFAITKLHADIGFSGCSPYTARLPYISRLQPLFTKPPTEAQLTSQIPFHLIVTAPAYSMGFKSSETLNGAPVLVLTSSTETPSATSIRVSP